ncbi:unnamed protein product, partial [Rotaria magnacalcarata]
VDQSHNYRSSKIHHFTAWNDESTQKNEDIANYDDDDDDDRPTMDNTKPPLSSPHNYQQTHPIHRNASFKEVQQNSHRSMYNNTNNQCGSMSLLKLSSMKYEFRGRMCQKRFEIDSL